MARTNKAENQHYVPRMLLRNFVIANSEQVYAFDKQLNWDFRTNIKNVVTERSFYDVVFQDCEGSIEPALSQLEGVAESALRKLIDAKSLGVLSAEERSWIGIFIAAQHIRVRAFREMSQTIDAQLTMKVLEMGGDPQKVKGWKPFAGEQDLQNFAVSFLLQSIPDFSRMMQNKVWILMEAKRSDPFWISDNPVTMHNSTDMRPYGNIGLAVPGIQIHLPLSPTLTLALWCPSILEEMHQKLAEAKSAHQRMRFQRLFGSARNRPSLDQDITKYEDVIRFNEEMMARIGQGRPLLCTAENVMFFNSLQVIWSERYLLSWKQEFCLAKRMIADDPIYRQGRRMCVN